MTRLIPTLLVLSTLSGCTHRTPSSQAPSQSPWARFEPGRKYLDLAKLELGLAAAARGDERARGMVQKALLKNTALLNPIDGGAHDYSIARPGRDPWHSPVETRSLRTQAINLRLYSLAHQTFGGHRYLDAARKVYRFVRLHRDEAGGFHEEHDTRISTTHNALMISALAAYYEATGEPKALESAVLATERMMAERMLQTGEFKETAEGSSSRDATEAMRDAVRRLNSARDEQFALNVQ